jgi:beta-lactamase superfamily II metal-dependent hydrolase
MMATIKYLKTETANLYAGETSNEVKTELLWGDKLEILSTPFANGRVNVKARGMTGFIKDSVYGDDPLLELYFIDVGQGDGILIVTPDRQHILIDGGYNRSSQPHGKSAADFVDWKFNQDYGLDKIDLDVMIASHCDADHYGGLWDIFNPDEKAELDCTSVSLKNFYHAGVSWWKSASNSRFLGTKEDGFLNDLLEGKNSVQSGLDPSSPLKLQGNWALFMKLILNSGAKIERISYNPDKDFEYLPGFEPGKKTMIKILGPIEQTIDGKAKLKDFGSDSQNTNGNSILLRVDYGRARFLLTGDLNKKSEQYILDKMSGNRAELSADVAKSCHHGSDDCSYEFMESIQASASILSSGDDESHAHPRPNIVATCGICGYRLINDDELKTPLIYSTEISRSYKLGDPDKVDYKGYSVGNQTFDVHLEDEAKTIVGYRRTSSGALKPAVKTKSLDKIKIVDGIVYGLVNVRTDGNKILCATLNEGKSKWEVQTFNSRF